MLRKLALVAGGLLLGCATCAGAGGDRAVIEGADLVGDWGNGAGARLHIAADHTANGSGLRHAVPDRSCPTEVSAARWEFFAPQGPRKPEDSLWPAKGDSFGLDLAPSSCSVFVAVQRDDDGYDLCLVMDPDQTCTDEELLRRLPTPSG
ncbi:hypothetical protein ACH4E7_42210 [Kitasatospora sp. NPDC018058]|uniref:hypothetical protein n=1 Tax=Kitasatospora sp. NPDC018058 TaxID=3364025 RepID=UPI0037BE53AD